MSPPRTKKRLITNRPVDSFLSYSLKVIYSELYMLSIYNLEDIQTKSKLTHFHCNFNFLDTEEIEKIFELVNRIDYSSAIF